MWQKNGKGTKACILRPRCSASSASIEYIRELEGACERLKEQIAALELANKTLRRRVESLEGVAGQ